MSTLGTFVWSIADQLRGVYKPHQYGNVILPFTILRRLDAILAPSRDEVRVLAKKYDGDRLAVEVRRTTGLRFHNTSQFDFNRLLADPEGLTSNLTDYISRFSANIDVFDRFKFENEIATLAEKDLLYLVVQKFAEVDLHPTTISNADMGDLFEELIRRFAEASNEEAGEHFTPRDAIRLIVDLLFADEQSALSEPGAVRSVYDPTVGTGGFLSVAEERLLERNADARLALYGQEINDQSYAIAKSDLIAKGQDAANIRLGNTLADDRFAGTTFDFVLSNPPYGVDWKASLESVKAEAAQFPDGRFGHGLPSVSDGQLLFLTHVAHKMRPKNEGGGRAGIVLNGSPLFNGGAGSGPSEIRRWLLESDLVDAIVALPTNLFFNTGIATYVWILDTDKQPERRGKVQLIDATRFWTKLRKNLGSKNREVGDADRDTIVKLYDAFDDGEHSKIFDIADFGYWTITVERPLLDDDGKPVTDRNGNPKPDPKLRDTENVPFNWSAPNSVVEPGPPVVEPESPVVEPVETTKPPVVEAGARSATLETTTDLSHRHHPNPTIDAYFTTEVLPHVPDAWIDDKKTKVGYEIPFTRHFYKYVPPRPLEEIDADLEKLVGEILVLLKEVEG